MSKFYAIIENELGDSSKELLPVYFVKTGFRKDVIALNTKEKCYDYFSDILKERNKKNPLHKKKLIKIIWE